MKSVIQLLKEYREQMGRNTELNSRAVYTDSRITSGPLPREKLLNMAPSEFSKQNLKVKMRSRLLADDFYLASNESIKHQIKDGAAVYLPDEMRWLILLSNEDKKLVHRLKKELGGTFDCVN